MPLKRHGGAADQANMRAPLPRASDERGYTLVELLVAAMVLVVGLLGTFTLIDGANKTTVTNNARIGATNLAREILENARSLDYDVLTDTQLIPAIQAKPNMSGTRTPWKVQRRGIVFTVEADVCTFDDPKDNVATMAPPDVCTPQAPVQAAAGTLKVEDQPDDFRRMNVKLTWNTGGRDISINQTALISNPSGGMGPRITTFTAPPDNVNQFASTATTATFPTVTTNAASVRWNSDGNPNGAGDSTGGPTAWNTTWALGAAATPISPPASGAWPAQYTAATVFDGTYTVTAQAFDDRGIAGDSRAAILPLNRSSPITVTGLTLGRNTYQNTIEFSWEPNPERDVIGYEVWNAGPDNAVGGGNDELVCATADVSATSCSSATNPPWSTPGYYVVALDKPDIVFSTTATRRSPHARVISVPSSASPAPMNPLLLAVTLPSDTGNPRLNWTHPSPTTVSFFRIYRDRCCGVADRYGSTTGNGTNWVDPNPGGLAHRYWVTAVGPTLNESSPSNSADSVLP